MKVEYFHNEEQSVSFKVTVTDDEFRHYTPDVLANLVCWHIERAVTEAKSKMFYTAKYRHEQVNKEINNNNKK